jgi:hypothetical protein
MDTFKKYNFRFLEPFRARLLISLQKVLIFFLHIFNMDIKKAEFDADFNMDIIKEEFAANF